MKFSIISFLLVCLAVKSNYAQDHAKNKSAESYEMKQYFFVMLVNGENRKQDSATAAKIQYGHMANITRLAKMGKIVVAGPFGEENNWRGIFIFDCTTKEEVEQYLKTDPAISSGRLSYEIHPWWTAKNCLFK
jgi:hypothetical protein